METLVLKCPSSLTNASAQPQSTLSSFGSPNHKKGGTFRVKIRPVSEDKIDGLEKAASKCYVVRNFQERITTRMLQPLLPSWDKLGNSIDKDLIKEQNE